MYLLDLGEYDEAFSELIETLKLSEQELKLLLEGISYLFRETFIEKKLYRIQRLV